MRPEFGNQKHINLRDSGAIKEVKKNLQGQINCPFCGSSEFVLINGDVLNNNYLVKFYCKHFCKGESLLFSFSGNGDLKGQKISDIFK